MYKEISLRNAYRLLNAGSMIIVSTFDKQAHYNLTPIAWNCPVEYDPVTQLLLVCSNKHKAYDNILKTNTFTVVLPHLSQKELVVDLGKISGNDTDKLEALKVEYFFSEKLRYPVPVNSIGYIDCKLLKNIHHGEVNIIIGESIYAAAAEESFKQRLLAETNAGKPLHHLGNKIFTTFTNEVF